MRENAAGVRTLTMLDACPTSLWHFEPSQTLPVPVEASPPPRTCPDLEALLPRIDADSEAQALNEFLAVGKFGITDPHIKLVARKSQHSAEKQSREKRLSQPSLIRPI
jgi:hypothetical protein